MESAVVLYQRDGAIATIKLNRPYRLNAINSQVVRELRAALEQARQDGESRVIVLRGEGRAFSSGDDIKESAGFDTAEAWVNFMALLQEIARAIRRLGKPTICALQGYAIGAGCGLAMLCDIRIAAEGTKMGFAETGILGTVGCAGSQMLARLVGPAKAKEIFFTGELVEAREAERLGLVNRVVPLGELDRAVAEMARKVATMATRFPNAVQLTREAVDLGLELGFDAMLDLELYHAAANFASGELTRGMKGAVKELTRQ